MKATLTILFIIAVTIFIFTTSIALIQTLRYRHINSLIMAVTYVFSGISLALIGLGIYLLVKV